MDQDANKKKLKSSNNLKFERPSRHLVTSVHALIFMEYWSLPHLPSHMYDTTTTIPHNAPTALYNTTKTVQLLPLQLLLLYEGNTNATTLPSAIFEG